MLSLDVTDLRVLIIEDNAHFRSFLRSLLEVAGITHIREASDGREALEILKEYPADLATVDQKMAGVSGLEFVRQVRDELTSPCPFLPIIMMTGNTDADLIMQAREAGVNDLVTKPVSALSLLARVQAILENVRPFVRTADYFGPDRRQTFKKHGGVERRKEQSPFIMPKTS